SKRPPGAEIHVHSAVLFGACSFSRISHTHLIATTLFDLNNYLWFARLTGTAAATFLLIPVCMFFLLLYREKFKQFLHQINRQPRQGAERFPMISVMSQQYVRAVAIVIVILTVLNTIGFTLRPLSFLIGEEQDASELRVKTRRLIIWEKRSGAAARLLNCARLVSGAFF
ncbi:MAG TPA: hypothetical protein PKH43_13200, partial [Saprospiraceae bacterium]|nr:hypothetical protein [Saprospiraceae bacterium]